MFEGERKSKFFLENESHMSQISFLNKFLLVNLGEILRLRLSINLDYVITWSSQSFSKDINKISLRNVLELVIKPLPVILLNMKIYCTTFASCISQKMSAQFI